MTRIELERRIAAHATMIGLRRTLRCEWPAMADCGGRECDRSREWCDGCRRSYGAWQVNARINNRAAAALS